MLQNNAKTKLTKNTKCITPKDIIVAEWLEAIDILNEFKKLGFETRESFVSVVQQLDTEYLGYKKAMKLQQFWAFRLRNEYVNQDLRKIIEQLKAE